jgi:hypothetical protein
VRLTHLWPIQDKLENLEKLKARQSTKELGLNGYAEDCARFIDEQIKIDEPQGGDVTVIPFKLWPAQSEALTKLLTSRLLIILKARQLGVTWLCCAYALWLCLFKPGQVVLLFSKGAVEAYELARRIREMYSRLPESLRLARPLLKDNLSELTWANGSRIQSLAATRSAGRSFTASLVLMDEAAFMQWATELYTALKPTVDGGGQLFIVSTANGEHGFFHKLWTEAEEGINHFTTLFLSWRARPDRDDEWRARVSAEALSSVVDLQEYPNLPIEAFQSSETEGFLPSIALWDACMDTSLPPLDGHTSVVLAMDAGESSDTFATLLVSAHPSRERVLAVRYVRVYVPKREVLDFDAIEEDIRDLCKRYAVREIVYDPMLLGQMMRRLATPGRKVHTPLQSFPQGAQRLEADRLLFDLILQRRITHNGDKDLRAHLENADRKLERDGRTLRIIKRSHALKIDAAVALSMAVYRASTFRVDRYAENENTSWGYRSF